MKTKEEILRYYVGSLMFDDLNPIRKLQILNAMEEYATQRTAEVGGLIKYIDSEILYFEDLASKKGINHDGRVRLEIFKHIKELLNRDTPLPEPPKNSEDGVR